MASGQQERERAFRRWWLKHRKTIGFAGMVHATAKEAFNTGVEHGLELRGCCDHKEPRDG